MWMVYKIKRIETKKLYVFILPSGPIVLNSSHSSFASSLFKLGYKEFYWAQSGPFIDRREAREIQNKFINDDKLNPSVFFIEEQKEGVVDEQPWTERGIQKYKYKPRSIIGCSLKTREEFIMSSIKLRKINSEYQEAYRTTHDTKERIGSPRKTDDQKAITKINTKQRNKQNRLLKRAGKLGDHNKKYNDPDNLYDDEVSVLSPESESSLEEYENEVGDIKNIPDPFPWLPSRKIDFRK